MEFASMKCSSFGGFAAVALLVSSVSAVAGKVAAPAPVPERVARADVVITGKVTGVEKAAVKIDGAECSIAIVQVEDAILGATGKKEVRVAFYGENRRFPHLNLKEGQESLFFL